MIKLVFPSDTLPELAGNFRAESKESFALILARAARVSKDNWRLLVESVHVPTADEYESRTETFVRPSASFRLIHEKRARVEGLSLIYCHSHPRARGIPVFSPTDDDTERELASYAQNRVKGVPHLSLLIGADGINARELGTHTPAEVFSVGRSVVRFFAQDEDGISVEHDRQVRAFGEKGQRAMQGLRIGIVGLGGTGSLIAQALAHLGVRRYVLIDPDTIDTTSLNRVVGATKKDVGRPKVAVAKRSIKRLVADAEIAAIRGDILQRSTGKRLLDVDFIFCCTDSHGSRHFLNQLAYQYFLPCIDMGVAIDADDSNVLQFGGRVKMLGPSMSCLICQGGILSPDQVRWDLANENQRNADPYFLEASGVKQPSVISLNSTVTSLATTMFLSAVAGVPAKTRSQFYRGIQGVVRVLDDTPREGCVNCSPEFFFGRGAVYELPARAG